MREHSEWYPRVMQGTFINRHEVAERLRVSPEFVRKHFVNNRHIHFYHVGHQMLWSIRAIDRWVEKNLDLIELERTASEKQRPKLQLMVENATPVRRKRRSLKMVETELRAEIAALRSQLMRTAHA